MAAIENFAALPTKEQHDFAVALLKTINTESIFSDDVEFELTGIEADDFTGGLAILVDHTDSVRVPRAATWTCGTEEDASDDPGYDADYQSPFYTDVKKAFKTLSTVIDDYKVSLDIADVDAGDNVEVIAEHLSYEDAGIGHYEYWGREGYDSNPYIEVEGTIVQECECVLSFFVEPDDTVEPEVEEEN